MVYNCIMKLFPLFSSDTSKRGPKIVAHSNFKILIGYAYLINCFALNMQSTHKTQPKLCILHTQLLATASHFGMHEKVVFGLHFELHLT